MNLIQPAQTFSGVTLVISPHMDDEILACGGILANLPKKEDVFIVYATNGNRSPCRPGEAPSPVLEEIRTREARQAVAVFGIPRQNLFFLGLPDYGLSKLKSEITHSIAELIHMLQPNQLLIPFRYDRHPDHLALHIAAQNAASNTQSQADIYEYFVYNRYRLLPGGDIRRLILPELVLCIDTHEWSAQKKEALRCYRSQTTLFFAWQTRPILPSKRVEEVCRGPEIFIRTDPAFPGASVFGRAKHWVRLIHILEPRIKNQKELILSFLHSASQPVGKRIY